MSKHDGMTESIHLTPNTTPEDIEKLRQLELARETFGLPTEASVFQGLKQPKHDEGNAHRVATYFRHKLRYSKDLDQWFLWDGRYWAPCTRGDELAVGRYVADALDLEVTQLTGEKRDAHREWASRSHSVRAINAMMTLAKGDRQLWVAAGELDANPWLLNCMNGTVDLRTGQLLAHNPDNLITQLVPRDYDPYAVAPTFVNLVARTFYDASRDGQTLDFVQRALGYSVLGRNLEHRLVIVEGDSYTGKTTVIETVAKTLGSDYTHKSKTELIARVRNGHHSSERLSLTGKRFVYISETSSTWNLDEATVKELTGDSSITTYTLYTGVERVAPVTWTIWLATNEFPNVLDWDDAVRRRVVVLPAGPTVPEQDVDKTLSDRIVATEAQGVLTYLVRGCTAWYQTWMAAQHDPQAANTGLSLPPAVMMRTQQYAESQDHVGHFIEECLVADPAYRTPRKDVLEAFKRWRGKGETANRNQLYARVQKAFGCEVYRMREFVGIRLVDPGMPSWPRINTPAV